MHELHFNRNLSPTLQPGLINRIAKGTSLTYLHLHFGLVTAEDTLGVYRFYLLVYVKFSNMFFEFKNF